MKYRWAIWLLFAVSVLCGVLSAWMFALVFQGSGKMWLDFVRLIAALGNAYNVYTSFKLFWYYKRLFMAIDAQQRR